MVKRADPEAGFAYHPGLEAAGELWQGGITTLMSDPVDPSWSTGTNTACVSCPGASRQSCCRHDEWYASRARIAARAAEETVTAEAAVRASGAPGWRGRTIYRLLTTLWRQAT
jgi:hypothetical protein